MPGLLDLPVEIARRVCTFLPKKDLAALAVACKLVAPIVQSVLFQNVTLRACANKDTSAALAKQVDQHKWQHVRRLTLHIDLFEIPEDATQTASRRSSNTRSGSSLERNKQADSSVRAQCARWKSVLYSFAPLASLRVLVELSHLKNLNEPAMLRQWPLYVLLLRWCGSHPVLQNGRSLLFILCNASWAANWWEKLCSPLAPFQEQMDIETRGPEQTSLNLYQSLATFPSQAISRLALSGVTAENAMGLSSSANLTRLTIAVICFINPPEDVLSLIHRFSHSLEEIRIPSVRVTGIWGPRPPHPVLPRLRTFTVSDATSLASLVMLVGNMTVTQSCFLHLNGTYKFSDSHLDTQAIDRATRVFSRCLGRIHLNLEWEPLMAFEPHLAQVVALDHVLESKDSELWLVIDLGRRWSYEMDVPAYLRMHHFLSQLSQLDIRHRVDYVTFVLHDHIAYFPSQATKPIRIDALDRIDIHITQDSYSRALDGLKWLLTTIETPGLSFLEMQFTTSNAEAQLALVEKHLHQFPELEEIDLTLNHEHAKLGKQYTEDWARRFRHSYLNLLPAT